MPKKSSPKTKSAASKSTAVAKQEEPVTIKKPSGDPGHLAAAGAVPVAASPNLPGVEGKPSSEAEKIIAKIQANIEENNELYARHAELVEDARTGNVK